MAQRWTATVAMLLALGSSGPIKAAVPNHSFEQGTTAPLGWELSGGEGTWEKEGHVGQRCISVTGDGKSSNFWKCPSVVFQPGKTYLLEFWTKSSPDAGGEFVITGNPSCNFDWPHAKEWTQRTTIAKVPPYRPEQQAIRFGHWRATGKVYFDDIGIVEVQPVYGRSGMQVLGEGEKIAGGKYEFVAPLDKSLNDSRPLEECTAPFDTNRWRLDAEARLVFRHHVNSVDGKPCRFSNARVNVSVSYYNSGLCLAEASRDEKSWSPLGQLEKNGSADFRLPADFDGATSVAVRLTARKKEGEAKGPSLQVNGYTFSATLDPKGPDMQGKTSYLPGDAALYIKAPPARPPRKDE